MQKCVSINRSKTTSLGPSIICRYLSSLIKRFSTVMAPDTKASFLSIALVEG